MIHCASCGTDFYGNTGRDRCLCGKIAKAAIASLPVEAITAGIEAIELVDSEDYPYPHTSPEYSKWSARKAARKAHISALQSLLPEDRR